MDYFESGITSYHSRLTASLFSLICSFLKTFWGFLLRHQAHSRGIVQLNILNFLVPEILTLSFSCLHIWLQSSPIYALGQILLGKSNSLVLICRFEPSVDPFDGLWGDKRVSLIESFDRGLLELHLVVLVQVYSVQVRIGARVVALWPACPLTLGSHRSHPVRVHGFCWSHRALFVAESFDLGVVGWVVSSQLQNLRWFWVFAQFIADSDFRVSRPAIEGFGRQSFLQRVNGLVHVELDLIYVGLNLKNKFRVLNWFGLGVCELTAHELGRGGHWRLLLEESLVQVRKAVSHCIRL